MRYLSGKPAFTKSNFAVPGLYFTIIQWLPSQKIFNQVQGEYEITDVNKAYLEQGKLRLVY
jgi:glucose-1-phosphate thymidylyltransferase